MESLPKSQYLNDPIKDQFHAVQKAILKDKLGSPPECVIGCPNKLPQGHLDAYLKALLEKTMFRSPTKIIFMPPRKTT